MKSLLIMIFLKIKKINMKYWKLEKIVLERANELGLNAAYSGSHDDGGASFLRNKLNNYRHKLVEKLDLRPSEFVILKNSEVGEPHEFSKIIEEHKITLAKNIKL